MSGEVNAMWNVEDEIDTAVQALKIDVKKLPTEKGERVREMAIENFATESLGARVFERLNDFEVVYAFRKWHLVDDFLQFKKNVFMFFGTEGNTSVRSYAVYEFIEGANIVPLIKKVDGRFTYYLVNKELTYLLCNSEEDEIIACGTAKQWLKDRIEKGWFDEER